jgi:hypothetical protein
LFVSVLLFVESFLSVSFIRLVPNGSLPKLLLCFPWLEIPSLGRPTLLSSPYPSGTLEAAQTTLLKNKDMFKKMNKKQLVFEQDKDDTSILDENQLKE